jgi:hypothetical protein
MLHSFIAGAVFVALVLIPCVIASFSHPDRNDLTPNRDLARHDIAI